MKNILFAFMFVSCAAFGQYDERCEQEIERIERAGSRLDYVSWAQVRLAGAFIFNDSCRKRDVLLEAFLDLREEVQRERDNRGYHCLPDGAGGVVCRPQ